jgi:RNA polymerase sigma-70 factor
VSDPAPSHADATAGLAAFRRTAEPRLRAAYAAACQEVGGMLVTFEVFSAGCERALVRRLAVTQTAATALALHDAWERSVSTDLFLAIACDAGNSRAWEALVARLGPRLRAFLQKRGEDAASADEIVASLPGELLLPAKGSDARTQLGLYSGAGSLFSWLGSVAIRMASRSGKARRTRGETAEAATIAAPGPDPAVSAIDAEVGDRARKAVDEAFGSMSSDESVAFVLCYRDGVPQVEIGEFLRVGKSRITRILQSAVAKVRRAFGRNDLDAGAAEGSAWSAFRDAVGRALDARRAPDRASPERGGAHAEAS